MMVHLAGEYLGTSEENDKLTLLPAKEAKLVNTLFRFRQSLVSLNYSNRAVTHMCMCGVRACACVCVRVRVCVCVCVCV